MRNKGNTFALSTDTFHIDSFTLVRVFEHLVMSTGHSQVTGSLAAAVLNEKIRAVTNEKLHTPGEMSRVCLAKIIELLKLLKMASVLRNVQM